MLPYRRAIALLHVVTLLLVLAAAAVRAPLRAEGTVPQAAISAVIACLVVFAIQGLLASMPALKRIYAGARQTSCRRPESAIVARLGRFECGQRRLTFEGGLGCICTLTPSSDWLVGSRWCSASRTVCR